VLASRYNKPGFEIFDYNIYAVCGDGCMMEGVASEAASLAGHLALDNLCWLRQSTASPLRATQASPYRRHFRHDFLGYGWHVLRVGDANDVERIVQARTLFNRRRHGRPSSSWIVTSVTVHPIARILLKLMASRWAMMKFASRNAPTAGPKTQSISGRRSMIHFKAGIGERGAGPGRVAGTLCELPGEVPEPRD